MNRLGVIARADNGGLGSQTRDLVEHLDADAALVVLLGADARGAEDVTRFAGRRVFPNYGPAIEPHVLSAFLEAVDVVYTIEGPYCRDLHDRCQAAGVRLVMHANPELWRGWSCDEVIVPTSWRQADVGGRLLPFPVDTVRLLPSPRAEVPRFAHMLGPAMLDRQGTQLVEAAFPHVRSECEIVFRHDGQEDEREYGNVRVRWLPRTVDYRDAIPDGCWALLQPRRYGGLSLPIQEAAARGLPTLCLAREPETTFYAPLTVSCDVLVAEPYPMAGGLIDVCECDPRKLAALIDEFVEADGMPWLDPRGWAEAHSWSALRGEYEAILRG